jgi:2-oxoisovalerate dehydrogenase E1 component
MTQKEFYPNAYKWMILSRKTEEKLRELFKKRYVKGTVTMGFGNEATAVGMGLPLRRGQDVVSFLHRDFAAHLIMGSTPLQLLNQYMANAESPTRGREGNAHHGNADERRFPMISHLGNMVSLVVGGTWAARKRGEDIVGVSVSGDGGTSTGDFHESLNIASVRKVPVLFLIENNHYAYSVPTRLQYNCEKLSDRAKAYNISGKTIDGADPWDVYTAVCDSFDEMRKTSLPYLLECMTLRLDGHAVYDKAEYIPADLRAAWLLQDPIVVTRKKLIDEAILTEEAVFSIEVQAGVEVENAVRSALACERPDPKKHLGTIFAVSANPKKLDPFKASGVKNFHAVSLALDYILSKNDNAVLLGMDIGPKGSAFATCKGLFDRFGPERVMDMPIAESAITGFALGASQTGALPIVEYQFADFATEATTQIGLNCGTWFFRSGRAAPMLLRLPCGGGITLGAFHSGEFDGLWSRFPGLKVLYPYTTQELFEALIAGFYDPNPCIVLEHKLHYVGKGGDIDFDGDAGRVWRTRKYADGSDITIVGFGAALDVVHQAVLESSCGADIFNPFMAGPLDMEPIFASIKKTGRLLVVQDNNDIAGLGNHVVSHACRECFGHLKRAPEVISAPCMPVPFAPELEAFYRPNKEMVVQRIATMMGEVT